MSEELKLSKFAKYAWFVLAYNVVVILWGVFLRASKSGDGCGQHWLTCNGEVIPSAPQLKTIIEFSHRITSSLAGIFIVVLLVWVLINWFNGQHERKKHLLKAAICSFIFVALEGWLGARLVLTGNTAETLTPERPFWMAAHLVNTFILLAFLSLTAWFAGGGKKINFRTEPKVLLLLILGVLGIFIVGISGSIAALSSMIFPSASLAEGVAKDFSETSHILLRLRVFHPILSIIIGVFLIFLAGWLKSKTDENSSGRRWTKVLSILILVQFAWGALTFLTLAPILMQLVHLLLADAIWIAFVLMSANFLAEQNMPAENADANLILQTKASI
ncbi:MAG: COX15/CtaA family protein [Pyrinomonadaceae bacterium]